ncbi:hypothetical protein O9G_006391, partial [Rozella allomycis CSF55]
MRSILKDRNLWVAIENGPVGNEEKDRLAQIQLKRCVAPKYLAEIEPLKTAKEMWALLAKLESKGVSNVLNIFYALMVTEMKDDEHPADFFTKFKEQMNKLVDLGLPMSDGIFGILALKALPGKYAVIKGLLGLHPDMSTFTVDLVASSALSHYESEQL